MSFRNVVDVLKDHFLSGEGLARTLRSYYVLPNDQIEKFFDSTDYIERLLHANNLSTRILKNHNMEYLEGFRDRVRQIETMLEVEYPFQRDHTIHTLYMYLLGIWFFDNSKRFRNAFKHQWDIDTFEFQWTFTSLLHDIGYIFHDPIGNHDQILDLDQWFSLDYLPKHFPGRDKETITKLSSQVRPRIEKWLLAHRMPIYVNAKTPDEILRELRKAPWIYQLPKEIGIPLNSTVDLILRKALPKIYPKIVSEAGRIAKSGDTAGSERHPRVDHGFASGLLLFQLTTFRYWLISLAQSPEIRNDLTALPNYDRKYFHSFIEACCITAVHSLFPYLVQQGKLDHLKLKESPLLFLSHLCDELQFWHRPPVSREAQRTIDSYEVLTEKNLWLNVLEYKPSIKILCSNTNILLQVKKIEDSILRCLHSRDVNRLVDLMFWPERKKCPDDFDGRIAKRLGVVRYCIPNRDIFHSGQCHHVSNYELEDLDCYINDAEAIEFGKRPCKNCHEYF